ncbi:MAG: hypothetical protein ACI85O_000864 [Saprospiraceae bacterium]|jgi:hypothetical protein
MDVRLVQGQVVVERFLRLFAVDPDSYRNLLTVTQDKRQLKLDIFEFLTAFFRFVLAVKVRITLLQKAHQFFPS